MNILTDYIKNHSNWRKDLSEDPYNLSIKDDGPYTIFTYSQIKSDFSNPIVKVSRGIIVKNTDTEPTVVCRAFDKFFNYNEKEAAPIDWNTAKVLTKIDGSIIKWWHDNGHWHISTNGMIDAFNCDLMTPTEKFKTFGDLFIEAAHNSKVDISLLDKSKTWIFELTSPWNRVVIPYREIKIFHIGTRDTQTGEEFDIDIGIEKPQSYGEYFWGTSTYPDLSKILEQVKILPYDKEGYVAVDKNWNRVKIKGLQYLYCHRLKGESFSQSRAFDLLKTGEHTEFLSYFPEYTSEFARIKKILDQILLYIKDKEKELEKLTFSTRKDFALYIKDWVFCSYFFSKLDNKAISTDQFIASLDWKRIPSIFLDSKKG